MYTAGIIAKVNLLSSVITTIDITALYQVYLVFMAGMRMTDIDRQSSCLSRLGANVFATLNYPSDHLLLLVDGVLMYGTSRQ